MRGAEPTSATYSRQYIRSRSGNVRAASGGCSARNHHARLKYSATKIAIRPKYRAGSAITNGQAGAPFATKRTAIARYAAKPTPLISHRESAVHIEPIVLRTPRRRGTRLIERNALRAFRPQ